MTSTGYYEVGDIVRESGLPRASVTRYLRSINPKHPRKSWHRLTDAEFRATVATLKAAKASCPKQPLHALARNSASALVSLRGGVS